MFKLETFYQTREWRDLVELLKLERIDADGDLRCEDCGGIITAKYDCIGHHVIELNHANVNDAAISLNPDNIRLVHLKCHNAIHKRFGYQRRRQTYLVYGSPCSGKTTYVLRNASRDDLIVDMDRLFQAVTVCDLYDKPDRLASYVFALRDTLIDRIYTGQGQRGDAWIIGGYPQLMERQRLIDRLGAREVFIDTPKEICEARARERNGKWPFYVADWWGKFQPTLPRVA